MIERLNDRSCCTKPVTSKPESFVRTLFLVAALLFVVPVALADTLRIGSKRFTESYILAHLLGETASGHAPVKIQSGLGNTAIVFEALRSGSIDLYPEYSGTIALEILKRSSGKGATTIEELNRGLAPLGFGVAIPFGFNNGYALAMRAADAERLGVATLSDLARQRGLKYGLTNEFIGRADGWRGLAAAYGLRDMPTGLDHGLAYDAITAKQIDLMDIYTTDAKIGHHKLRVLEDDRQYFPRYDAVVLYRLDVPTRFPAAWQALQRLSGSIDEAAMIAMNARAELSGVAFAVIATDRLAGKVLSNQAAATNTTSAGSNVTAPRPVAPTIDTGARGFWAKLLGPDLARLTWQHLGLVVASVVIAALIAIPLAVLMFPHPRLRAVMLGFAGLLQTVPSLALLAILISLIGVIGTLPALLALTMYALLPIMRNTSTGLSEVSDGMRQAAMALGLSKWDRMRYIELPLARPTILAGVRTAAAISIGTATIAAFIGAGGYGERIVTGLALNDRELLLAGAIPAALLALVVELAFEWIERRSHWRVR